MAKPIIFSGIQPTSGGLHVGNYFGAVKNWVDLQADYSGIYQLVDLHALTAPFEPKDIQKNILELTAQILACGLDPKKTIFTVQSLVPEHTELSWIFGCLTNLGTLERMPTFKEKAAQYRSNINLGLFSYPVLQAADILLYRSVAVPVGEDQDPHLELARSIARTFNHRFGKFFPEPKTLKTTTPRIMGLDGEFKMSKSRGNDIQIVAAPEEIRRRLKRATTDSGRELVFSPDKPAVSNLLTIYASCLDLTPSETEKRVAGLSYADFKTELADVVIQRFAAIRERYLELRADEKYLHSVITQGAQACRGIAQPNLVKVKKMLGLS